VPQGAAKPPPPLQPEDPAAARGAFATFLTGKVGGTACKVCVEESK
jgi:hypothetical protein